MGAPWPDLDSVEPPNDWDPIHWAAVRVVHLGGFLKDAANEVGVSKTTINRWRKTWVEKYGKDFPRPVDRQSSLAKATQQSAENRALGLGGMQKWADVRAAAARDNGVTATLARQVAQQRLTQILADEELMGALTVDDCLALAKIADMLDKRADEMTRRDQQPTVTVATGVQFASGRPADEIPSGLLDALESDDADDGSNHVFNAAEEAAGTFLYLVEKSGHPTNGVIDVTESESK